MEITESAESVQAVRYSFEAVEEANDQCGSQAPTRAASPEESLSLYLVHVRQQPVTAPVENQSSAI